MSIDDRPTFPDVSDIHIRKREARRKNAALSFGEKIRQLEDLRERLAPMKYAREQRKKRDTGEI
jgi:hypothetical protein